MYTLADSLKFKGLPMRSKPLSFHFISRVWELEFELDSIHEKLSSIG